MASKGGLAFAAAKEPDVNNNNLTYESFRPSTATNKRYFGCNITRLKNVPYEIFLHIVDSEDDR